MQRPVDTGGMISQAIMSMAACMAAFMAVTYVEVKPSCTYEATRAVATTTSVPMAT